MSDEYREKYEKLVGEQGWRMTDRLAEIEADAISDPDNSGALVLFPGDAEWLIAEVRRLREALTEVAHGLELAAYAVSEDEPVNNELLEAAKQLREARHD